MNDKYIIQEKNKKYLKEGRYFCFISLGILCVDIILIIICCCLPKPLPVWLVASFLILFVIFAIVFFIGCVYCWKGRMYQKPVSAEVIDELSGEADKEEEKDENVEPEEEPKEEEETEKSEELSEG